jgi:hypothetical protein
MPHAQRGRVFLLQQFAFLAGPIIYFARFENAPDCVDFVRREVGPIDEIDSGVTRSSMVDQDVYRFFDLR